MVQPSISAARILVLRTTESSLWTIPRDRPESAQVRELRLQKKWTIARADKQRSCPHDTYLFAPQHGAT
jgi:hypothetical protein